MPRRILPALLSLVTGVALTPVGGSAASEADPASAGPQVGDRVPDFTLSDQHGKERSLASLMGPKGLVLVFFRSADW